MAEQDLIERITFISQIFMRIIIFAIFGVIFSYILNLDPIIGYKLIIFLSLVGSFIGVYDILERIKNK